MGGTGPEERERTSGISEIVGTTHVEEKTMHGRMAENFEAKIRELPEREKTPEEKAIIEAIISRLPGFVKKYGGRPLPLKVDNVYIIDESKISAEEKEMLRLTPSGYSPSKQSVSISYADAGGDKSKLYFAEKTLHELLHFCAFQSATRVYGKDHSLEGRRSGFSVGVRSTRESYFNDLDEALIQEAVIEFDKEFFAEIPELAEDLKKREMVKTLIREQGNDLSAEMVSFIAGNNVAVPHAYVKEILETRNLIHNLYLKNTDEYSSEEEIRNEFMRGVFSGRLLPVARMMEKTAGKGAFRRLGVITKKDRRKTIKEEDKQ